MSDWQQNIEHALSAADSPAVVSRDLLTRFARTANANQLVPVSTLTYWQKTKVREAKLAPVQRGLYLNCFRNKIGTLADAIPWLQRDAVVSLNTALGDSGVLNNPTNIITAVVPIDKGQPPPARLGQRKTRAGVLHLFGMPRHILQAGLPKDRLEPVIGFDHVRATPEKALIDWLYLGLSPRSNRTVPPRADIDIDLLDKRKFRRIASAANIRAELESWLESAE